MDHKNIVKFFGSFSEKSFYHETNFYLFIELCDCDLNTMLNDNSKYGWRNSFKSITIEEYFISSYIFNQILCAVNYLHDRSQPIIHRDIKPSNILVKLENHHVTLKLCDFGIGKMQDEDSSNTLCNGTQGYMAPEVMSDSKYNEKADIYSLIMVGIKLFKMNSKKL